MTVDLLGVLLELLLGLRASLIGAVLGVLGYGRFFLDLLECSLFFLLPSARLFINLVKMHLHLVGIESVL